MDANHRDELINERVRKRNFWMDLIVVERLYTILLHSLFHDLCSGVVS